MLIDADCDPEALIRQGPITRSQPADVLLLAALIVVQTLSDGHRFVLDARVPAVSAAVSWARPREALGWCAQMIGDRWGVTDAETRRRYPCDELVPDPVLELWRGVTVRAAPSTVWAWVSQIRLAPYSYDWIDNLGRTSPRELRDLPEPVVGASFTAAFGGRPVGRILAVEPGRHLTGTIMGAVMSYVLVPIDDGARTRLLLKVVARGPRITAALLSVGDLVMARRQLLNLAALAERTRSPEPAG